MSVAAIVVALSLVAAAPPSPAALPATPAPIVHVIDEKERAALEQTDNVRLSLPSQKDLDAWQNPGLRVQLGYGYGIVDGSGAAFSFRSQSALLRPSFRLDRWWALGIAMLYGTGPGGLRWSITAEPTYFPWRNLALSFGLGIGGLSVSDPNASPGTLKSSLVTVSRDVLPGERLTSCDGSALTSTLRLEYLFVVGPLFATGPFAQANTQWTHCQQTFGGTDNATGQPIALSAWWRQQGGTFGWWFAWR